jgi:hypothetical protein
VIPAVLPPAVTHRRILKLPIPALVGVALLVSLFVGIRVFAISEEPLDSFWRPVLSSTSPILLCIGNRETGTPTQPPPDLNLGAFHDSKREVVTFLDATTLSRFAGLLQSKGARYRVVSQSDATFSDLQNGPSVLIGLLNNDWTERLVGKLRFRVERQASRAILRDTQNPGREDWSLDFSTPVVDVTKDYALVIRVLDPRTNQMAVTAGGISVFGTLAAGEFLTDPKMFAKIESVAPHGWRKKNFELVLSADVIRGKSGHPEIVASQFW